MKVDLIDIRKYYGPVRANDGITIHFEPGTIHAVLGENGAGKSTLMKILSGYTRPDGGEIRLDGLPVRITSPAEAIAHGVGMLHQDPLDFPALTVLDDLLLGSPGPLWLNRARARRELVRLAAQFDFHLDPDARVSSLGIGEKQQLEIVRLLWLGVTVLILDEPTTAISAQQKDKLFATLRRLAEEGKTVIFVSHKLQEVAELCGPVTVLRHGKVAGETEAGCAPSRLVQMMFGQVVTLGKRPPTPLGPVALKVDGLTVGDWRLEVKDVSLEAQAGEVVGLAGLEGSGQRLVLQACAGLLRPVAGHLYLFGREMTGKPYRDFLDAGVAYMPAGRLDEGLIPGMTLTEHMALAGRSRALLVDWRKETEGARERIGRFNIKGTPESRVEELSGGNQQRALLALLPPSLKLLLMEHPTRGLDIGSIEYIWNLLQQRTQEGTSILFASSDLDELLDRSDRLLVFFGGRVRFLDARETNVAQLGELIGGKGF